MTSHDQPWLVMALMPQLSVLRSQLTLPEYNVKDLPAGLAMLLPLLRLAGMLGSWHDCIY
jgi:hypothetical protein